MTQLSETTRKQIAELCKKNKVRELSLFGSRARGGNRPDSHFDCLVDFVPNAGIGLIKYSRMQIDLSEIMRRRVDLVTTQGLKDHVRDNVIADAMPIYEA